MSLRIAIVGGGLSGTLTAIKVLQLIQSDVEITLFERFPEQLFRGIAYSSKLNFQPLNVRAQQMNIWHSRPGDFHQWLKQNWQRYFESEPLQGDFVRRDAFGDYVDDIFHEVLSQKKHHHNFRIVSEEVKQINKENSLLQIVTSSEKFLADIGVLALGNFLPGDVPIDNQEFYRSSLYQANPWETQWMKYVDKKDDVLFLGSGLTAIDQVINLLQQGHAGKINILSRRGFLPRSHTNYSHVELPPLPVYLGITINEVFQLIRERLKIYADSSVDWRNVIDAVRHQVPLIWTYLSTDEKKIFLRHLRPFWEIHRHRIPEESYAIIEDRIKLGQINVIAGRIANVIHENDLSATAFIRPRGEKTEKTLKVNKIINCTGPQSDFRKIDQPLIRDLAEKGWLQADELNLGLSVSQDGQLVGRSGVVVPNIFTIGSLRKGAMWECTALREITLQADHLVAKLNSDFVGLHHTTHVQP